MTKKKQFTAHLAQPKPGTKFTDKALSVVRGKEGYKPRKRGTHEALPPSSDMFKRPVYEGTELRDYDGRPGAMNAYYLPSIINGQRTYPRGNK